jgi:hypothetical protein
MKIKADKTLNKSAPGHHLMIKLQHGLDNKSPLERGGREADGVCIFILEDKHRVNHQKALASTILRYSDKAVTRNLEDVLSLKRTLFRPQPDNTPRRTIAKNSLFIIDYHVMVRHPSREGTSFCHLRKYPEKGYEMFNFQLSALNPRPGQRIPSL